MTARFDRARVQAALRDATTTRHLTVVPNAVDDVGALFIAAFGDQPAVVIADDTTFHIAGARAQQSLVEASVPTASPHIFPAQLPLDASYAHVETIRAAIQRAPAGAIPIAVGSGTINDLVKRAASETMRPYMVVATAASMDGYTASGAALIVDGFKQTLACDAPVAVVADLEILRMAPAAMTAAGYGDLIGKITAGADWLLADALGIEPVIPYIWSMVQDPLRATIAAGAELHSADNGSAIEQLFLGLIVTGLAIQATGSSRCASGSEHQFSHFWEMQGLHHAGSPVSHGFKVALGTLTSTRIYEFLLTRNIEMIDLARTVSAWPSLQVQEDEVQRVQPNPRMIERALVEIREKYAPPMEIARRLNALRVFWPTLQRQLRAQLIPSGELCGLLANVGCPTAPEDIGLTNGDLRATVIAARQIRRRYTVLDLLLETGERDAALASLFSQRVSQAGRHGSSTFRSSI